VGHFGLSPSDEGCPFRYSYRQMQFLFEPFPGKQH
jgi:hypothetical protein